MPDNPLADSVESLPHRAEWTDVKSAPIYTALTIALKTDPLGVGIHLPELARTVRTPAKRPARTPRKVPAKSSPKPLDTGSRKVSNRK